MPARNHRATPSTVATELGNLGTRTDGRADNFARAINSVGTFDADGRGGQAPYDRLFLVHVPEPAGLALLGLGGVAPLRRRRCD